VAGEPVPVREALAATYDPAQVGDRWGPPWGTTWLRVRGLVPAVRADTPVELRLDLGFTGAGAGFQAEGLVYRHDGTPVKAINPRTPWVRITDSPFELYVEAAANPTVLDDFRPTPMGDVQTAGREPLYRLARAELAVFDEQVWQLQQDLEVLDQLAAELDSRDARMWEILLAVDRALDRVDMGNVAPAHRPPARRWPGSGRRRREPAHTASARLATRTSIRRGCGRSARRCARWPARPRTLCR
jgi:alpha-mannosidase